MKDVKEILEESIVEAIAVKNTDSEKSVKFDPEKHIRTDQIDLYVKSMKFVNEISSMRDIADSIRLAHQSKPENPNNLYDHLKMDLMGCVAKYRAIAKKHGLSMSSYGHNNLNYLITTLFGYSVLEKYSRRITDGDTNKDIFDMVIKEQDHFYHYDYENDKETRVKIHNDMDAFIYRRFMNSFIVM